MGAVGAKYRIAPNERLTLWPGIEGKFGNDHFTRTFFGVTEGESDRGGYDAYSPDGGFYALGASIEARYALSPTLALVGEAEYARLTGDAADAPFNELLLLGFRSSMQKEWDWRVSRGESLRNLEAFRSVLEHTDGSTPE